ncbi:hypothetical protein D3C75_563220 [compost metagenome]
MSTNAFKYRGQRELVTFTIYAGFHWAAAYEHGWDVNTQCAHHHARCNFITVRDADHAIEPMRGNYGFQGVSDDLAAWQ